MKKFFIKTFGCQANKSDSERITGDYLARGFQQTDNWKKADEIVINTCSVRQRAEDRVVGFVLNIEKHFHPKDKPKIILTGCMLHHQAKNIFKLLPQVDEILPINEVGFNSPSVRKDKYHAFVPISTGCDFFCTYCIVPYSRGREILRPAKEIINEIQNLADQDYQEITLLGQNVNSYPSFVILLQEISKIKKIKKINFITANPWNFHDQLIDEIAKNPKIDRFIHLPVQSGSNKILKLMNRNYTSADYLKLIDKIKANVPNVTFGTDIIVGFPGETDKDFQDTVTLAKEVGFSLAFVAQYSPRPGTASYRLYKDNVSPVVKKKRWQILENLINKPNLKTRPAIK